MKPILPLLGNMDSTSSYVVAVVITVWALFWKGISLWRAAHEEQRNWFIALLILNTLGILEIVYLFKFAKKKLTIDEMKSWIPKR